MVVGFYLKACQEFQNEKRGKAADVKDDVMAKHTCAAANKWFCSEIGT